MVIFGISNTTCSEDSTLGESVCYIRFVLNSAEYKGYVFGVAFGGLLSCLPTEMTRICIIPPGSAFLS